MAQCDQCESLRAAREQADQRIRTLETEVERLREQLREMTKLAELQRADLERFKQAYESIRPNCPERVAVDQLQLAFERVLASAGENLAEKAAAAISKPPDENAQADSAATEKGAQTPGPHGRRRLDISNLPVERVQIDPDDVTANPVPVPRSAFVTPGDLSRRT